MTGSRRREETGLKLPPSSKSLVVSIVSHGHGRRVHLTLRDLAAFSAGTVTRVVLTLNVSEAVPVPPAQGWPFDLEVKRNAQPLGFGVNHNRALSAASENFVCVLNPDVRWAGIDPFASMLRLASQPGVGLCYPAQTSAEGYPQDAERALPTPFALLSRHLIKKPEAHVDWVNAACMLLPTSVWTQAGGFDESYFMYCEDVDLCLRLRLTGLKLIRAPVTIVHAGERASRRHWKHFAWHLRSLLRLWQSPVYRQARLLLSVRSQGAGTIEDA